MIISNTRHISQHLHACAPLHRTQQLDILLHPPLVNTMEPTNRYAFGAIDFALYIFLAADLLAIAYTYAR